MATSSKSVDNEILALTALMFAVLTYLAWPIKMVLPRATLGDSILFYSIGLAFALGFSSLAARRGRRFRIGPLVVALIGLPFGIGIIAGAAHTYARGHAMTVSSDRLRKVAIAMHNYHQDYDHLPPAAI